MTLGSLLKLALRDLSRQRRRAALAIFIAIIGVTAVMVTRGWQLGMLEQIEREGAGVWLGGAQVTPRGAVEVRNALSLEPNLDVAAVREVAAKVPGVSVTSPRIRFFGRMFKGVEESAPFIGIAGEASTAPKVVPRLYEASRIVEGRLPNPDAPDEILVAQPLASSLKLKAGDTVTLLAAPLGGGLEGKDVKVAGIARAAFEENQRRAVIVSLALGQELLRMEGKATALVLGVEPLSEARPVARAVDEALRAKLGEGLETRAWDEINPRYQAARVIWRTSLLVTFIVVLLVALIGLSTTLALVISERAKEISTLVALGLSRRWVLLLFCVEAAALGLIGGLAGAVSATGALAALASGSGVRFHPPGGFVIYVRPHLASGDLAFAVIVVVVVAILVAFPIARRTARLQPAVVLR